MGDASLAAPRLEIRNLYKIFGARGRDTLALLKSGVTRADALKGTGDVVAVNDVSFEVREREIFVVMGLSGSGKSTLIRCINRLIEPTSGQILLNGADIVAANAETLRQIRREQIAMVFQHFALFPHMSVVDNVEYGLKVRGLPREQRRQKAREALAQVGLLDWASERPANLSGGMRQRVGIARALVLDPTVLLMDEPFGALDPLIRREMQLEVLKIRERFSGSIVFITHDLHEALLLGDRIAIMREGQLVQVGAPSDIINNPANDYVAAFTQDVDRGRVLTVQSVMRAPSTMSARDLTWEACERRFRDKACKAIFVLDEHEVCLGMILRQDGQPEARGDSVAPLDLLRKLQAPLRSTDVLTQVYARCQAEAPMAVLAPSGALCGVVHTKDVWGAIAERQ